jgi:uncharacterized repeat protein (TIGR03803 family)
MKSRLRSQCLLLVLIGSLALAARLTGQTFTVLHNFTPLNNNTNSDGAGPYAGLILSSNFLYGTARYGGDSGSGTVFKVRRDGTDFTNLHCFSASYPNNFNAQTNSDGFAPIGRLFLAGDCLYGATLHGGISGSGTLFKVKTDGTSFTNLYNFPGNATAGASPSAGLVLLSNILYGMASGGGPPGPSGTNGSLFALNTDGTGFTNLYDFTPFSSCCPLMNNDGANPQGGLILSGNVIYGTADGGGSGGSGTVFAMNTNGTDFSILHTFTTAAPGAFPRTNSDGVAPQGLILSANYLYGATGAGGSGGVGTIFEVSTNGTNFSTSYNFTPLSVPLTGTNSDGANPGAGLFLSGNTLYGTTANGGPSGRGTVFAIKTDDMHFVNLHSFGVIATNLSGAYTNWDGANPQGDLILSDNTLYGTASAGGNGGSGVIFSIFVQPQLTIVPSSSGQCVILTWPTNYAGFTLQSTTNLISPVWLTNSVLPVVVNDQITVTNSISGTQQFYRLSQ